MKCECCGGEIEGNYIEYGGKYFDRHDNDNCIKEWLYDRVTDECRYGTILNGEKVDLTKKKPKDKRYIEVEHKTAEKISETCEKYKLNASDVLSDLVSDYLDELIQAYDIKPIEEEPEGIEPSWSEPYLNSLGMSLKDFF
jgi:GTPase SAR1 family protein